MFEIRLFFLITSLGASFFASNIKHAGIFPASLLPPFLFYFFLGNPTLVLFTNQLEQAL